MLPALQDGALFASRYRVLRCIATGAMGAVHEVVHVETDRRRALKVMLPHIAEDDDLRERFKREARIAANVDSEHIVEVFDAGVDEPTGMPFLVMELLRGEELGKQLERVGRFPASEVVTYLHQAAMALDRTHEGAIVHRDLNPPTCSSPTATTARRASRCSISASPSCSPRAPASSRARPAWGRRSTCRRSSSRATRSRPRSTSTRSG